MLRAATAALSGVFAARRPCRKRGMRSPQGRHRLRPARRRRTVRRPPARQRAELARTSAYANSIGCNNRKFLIFGSDPPPQCGEIKGQIARMQASLSDLEGRSGGGREDLVARYNSECANAPRSRATSSRRCSAAAGRAAVLEPVNPETISPDEQQQKIEKSIEKEKKGANVSAGSYAVCVRTCDGSFFPISYGGASGRFEDVCRSLCPNADVQVYSFPFGGTIEQAVSLSGERYVDMPNALKFQQSFNSTCSCRRKGESWAQALAAAEAKYGHEAKRHSGDAGEVDRNVAPDHRQGVRRPEGKAGEERQAGRRSAGRGRAGRRRLQRPAIRAWPARGKASTPTARTRRSAPPRRRSAAKPRASPAARPSRALSTIPTRARRSPRPARTATRRRCG